MSSNRERIGCQRPNIMGTRHVSASGHYMASQAAFQILEDGGNAIDAGVTAGICTGVLETGYVSFAGVAPIIIFLAETEQIVTISGLGTWPRAASCAYFQEHHGGKVPVGIIRSVVPAAPDAWITALEKYGTKSFGDCARAAIRFAIDGFPMYPRMAYLIEDGADDYRRWQSSADLFLPEGRAPEIGKPFRQVELGRTIQFMADEEAAHAARGREAGLEAARDAFYRGDIAATLVKYHRENGGLMAMEDLAGFRVGIEPAVHAAFGDIDVYGCGPWCQGPMLMQCLKLLDGMDLAADGHNSAIYVHRLAEAIKLAAADREAYYGDPRFVDVPMEALLSDAYNRQRREMIRDDQAWPEMPPAGEASGAPWRGAPTQAASMRPLEALEGTYDTSYLCVVDGDGNAFSATPSDGSSTSPVIPGLGFCASSRGSQNRADPNHPTAIMPGKRPRLTPNPAIARRRGDFVMPFGTPGGDVQVQAMLQVFLNMQAFGMDPQSAVEAPRFASYSFPSSFAPHDYFPGRLNLEGKMDRDLEAPLAEKGHTVEWWPDQVWMAGSVCAMIRDEDTGVITGGADPRRTAYAVGW